MKIHSKPPKFSRRLRRRLISGLPNKGGGLSYQAGVKLSGIGLMYKHPYVFKGLGPGGEISGFEIYYGKQYQSDRFGKMFPTS